MNDHQKKHLASLKARMVNEGLAMPHAFINWGAYFFSEVGMLREMARWLPEKIAGRESSLDIRTDMTPTETLRQRIYERLGESDRKFNEFNDKPQSQFKDYHEQYGAWDEVEEAYWGTVANGYAGRYQAGVQSAVIVNPKIEAPNGLALKEVDTPFAVF